MSPLDTLEQNVTRWKLGITEFLTDSNHTLLNVDSPIRLPSHGNPTSPDLILASSHIVIDLEWVTLTTLDSDHQLIIVQLGNYFQMNFPEPLHRTFTGLKKADWDSFAREAEESFGRLELPSFSSTGEPQFRKILNSSKITTSPKITFLTTKPH